MLDDLSFNYGDDLKPGEKRFKVKTAFPIERCSRKSSFKSLALNCFQKLLLGASNDQVENTGLGTPEDVAPSQWRKGNH